MDTQLTALMINCTLKPSPAESSSDVLGRQILSALAGHGVGVDSIRAVDHDIRPGVETDMGDGDEWPALRERVLDADIIVFMTPTWLGQHSSVAQRVLERLDAELSETDDEGRPILFDKVAIAGVVGNEDGAHHITGILYQSLSDVGFTIPAQGCVYWNGEAMQGTDYKDLPRTPDTVAQTTSTAAANAVHLAELLHERRYPSS
ncbi:multimeric flavodoxin WrbA [Microbacterium ginsengiterrae]|uniref:Multimeric flavodoxin WrbA n=1 Tax=Microbacterium ginsengiterrae TaxID=546115 RepID=A0A7W9CB01_9MICO|nr:MULTISPECIES: NAD(P)H-dependent oxidoreductase [Microbacterium]MBB5741887.1 multimeric flavodoxin WrbA [Microbacterium ginsengiterrae]